ncbi:DUF3347 domain-containing protein [Pontibacter sp. 172403-2]|nr:DUF3347 domain-containing protein [Pontibacter sp. 172403-2]
MQRITITGALVAAFSFTACTEKQQESADTAQEQHQAMNHEAMSPESTTHNTVADAPDYAAAADPIKQQVAQLLGSYLKLKDALVATDPQVAKTEAQAVLTAAGNVDVAGLTAEQQQFATEKLEKIKQSASGIAGAADVAVQRNHFEALSEATFTLAKAFDATSETLYYQFCPMANNNEGGYWVSAEKEIRNPYMGEAMLTCGSTEEVLN